MLMIGLAGTTLAPSEHAWLKARGVSGVVLFSRNYSSRDQLMALIDDIRDVGGEEMLIAVDQEGGPVQRFRDGFTRLPPLSTIGAVYDRDPEDAIRLAEEHAWVMSSELRASGVDFSFAPVVDLARGNAAIGLRAFHADPAVTAELSQAYVRGMHLGGMAAVLKHFPGHGSVAMDTHKATAVDPRPLDVIRRDDLVPFAEALAAHAEAVMVAHVIYPEIDAQPAGFSSRWIKEILRRELGFTGAVISDDISMAAAGAAGGAAARVSAHLDAGCDLVLACFPDVVDEAIAAVQGRAAASPERIASLRGAVASTWDGLNDNPQRERFIARIAALHAAEGQTPA
ncbi:MULTISPECIES: beta-N-acetylhexosaminidase [unclassified Dyella]|uniref:beta-N-acetylhexosaminidase n=1 Tax=unclassified Dyella TaxID=2634549 RepID=UPI000C82D352|nr:MULTISPECIES: beta-N-acetylhexosaminidase [unclassified Dyella]MDR3445503.1 beta-N-acetylhexosaminidase [Dyella sp.]PMQ05271.1 Beta-hexosaminidase [Dyella sp. AD56]